MTVAARPEHRETAAVARITRGFLGRRPAERDGRLPPGQYDVGDDWPVLTAEVTPRLATDTWTFRVEGAVEQQLH